MCVYFFFLYNLPCCSSIYKCKSQILITIVSAYNYVKCNFTWDIEYIYYKLLWIKWNGNKVIEFV